MLKIYKIRRCFVRQLNNVDCGLSCMAMILKYLGRGNDIPLVRQVSNLSLTGVSLYDLKSLGSSLGLNCKCVEMSIEYLKTIDKPMILHMINDEHEDHFQVFFGTRKTKNSLQFLVADPSSQILARTELEMDELWRSKAALFIDDLPSSPQVNLSIRPIISAIYRTVPIELWFVLPLLSVAAILCGFAISWVLQAGFNEPLLAKSKSFLYALPVLLLIIGVFRSLFLYVRQNVLIVITSRVYEHLTDRLLHRISKYKSSDSETQQSLRWKRGHADIQRIQNGVANFFSVVLTDGALLISCCLLLAFLQLQLLFIVGFYFAMGIMILLIYYPVAACKQTKLLKIKALSDFKTYSKKSGERRSDHQSLINAKTDYERHRKRYMSSGKDIALFSNKLNLMMETVGNALIISIFVMGLFNLDKSIDYLTFALSVILSYLIASVFPRLSASFLTVCDSIEIIFQHLDEF